MGMYRCVECENFRDNDWDIGQEWEDGLICEDCAENHRCEWCGEMQGEGPLKFGMHLRCWKQGRDEDRADRMRDERAEG